MSKGKDIFGRLYCQPGLVHCGVSGMRSQKERGEGAKAAEVGVQLDWKGRFQLSRHPEAIRGTRLPHPVEGWVAQQSRHTGLHP